MFNHFAIDVEGAAPILLAIWEQSLNHQLFEKWNQLKSKRLYEADVPEEVEIKVKDFLQWLESTVISRERMAFAKGSLKAKATATPPKGKAKKATGQTLATVATSHQEEEETGTAATTMTAYKGKAMGAIPKKTSYAAKAVAPPKEAGPTVCPVCFFCGENHPSYK